ncbi:glycosyl transferase family 2 [Halorubrum distributum JCM 10247]|uniref:Glycosyl transferase family 2 n=1 Tax=Halorubrum distributum JCM 10247 TaxID=1227486 RepID=M0DMQ6_9EURY|nr:glycosyl transferase family 2 [Halorubrum terrestre JCM 10247]
MTTLEGIGTTLVVGSGVFIVTYYLLINAGYLLIHVLALFQLRDSVRESSWNPSFRASLLCSTLLISESRFDSVFERFSSGFAVEFSRSCVAHC